MNKPQTPAQRRAKADAKQRAMGRFGRKVWGTPAEHELLKIELARIRGET